MTIRERLGRCALALRLAIEALQRSAGAGEVMNLLANKAAAASPQPAKPSGPASAPN